jgi:hypothetical protein
MFLDASTPSFGTVAFLGFTDTSPFRTLTISVPVNDSALLLDVKFGSFAVPEPMSRISLGLGILTVAGCAARQRITARRN